jgi:protein-S-isoprenylcysteine O-methyltransferase Ste14
MSRAVTMMVFALAALATVAQVVIAAGDVLTRTAGASWTIVLYAALKAAVVTTFAVLVAIRPQARRPARDPVAFIACIAALGGAAALRLPTTASAETVEKVGLGIAVVGSCWMLASVFALGTCFGILPEARGLVTRGPYRLIRHPLYLGEITVCTGLVLASPSVGNLLLGAIFGAGQLVRMHLEEAELTAAFPEYAAYAARTPRLLAWPRPRATAASADRLGASPGSA